MYAVPAIIVCKLVEVMLTIRLAEVPLAQVGLVAADVKVLEALPAVSAVPDV